MKHIPIRAFRICTIKPPALLSIFFNSKAFAAIYRENELSAGLVPFHRAAQAFFGVVYTPYKAVYLGQMTVSRLVIHRAYAEVARSRAMPEKLAACGCDDTAVVLCHNMRDHGNMRAIVQDYAFFAVVDVYVICDNVLPDNEPVSEALNGNAANDVMVVLVARHHKSHGVAGICLKLLAKHGIAHGFKQAELAIRNVHAACVLQVHGRLSRVHFIAAHWNGKFKVCKCYERGAEFPAAGCALGRGKYGIWAGTRVVYLGRVPIGKDSGACENSRLCVARLGKKARCAVWAVHGAHLVAVEKAAGHFALKLDICTSGRDYKLGTHGLAADLLHSGRSYAVATRCEGKIYLSAAALMYKIYSRLYCRSIVGDSVSFCAEIEHVKTKLHLFSSASLYISNIL